MHIAYAKEYPNIIRVVHSFLQKGIDLNFSNFGLDDLYNTLSLPLTMLGEYGMKIAPFLEDLDDQAKKCAISAMKSIESLFWKCRMKSTPCFSNK